LIQEVEFRRGVYNTVAQSNEKTKIDEVRNTPVITVIEKPSLPARADGRGLVKFGLLAIVLGVLAAIGIGFYPGYADSATRNGRPGVRGLLGGCARYARGSRQDSA